VARASHSAARMTATTRSIVIALLVSACGNNQSSPPVIDPPDAPPDPPGTPNVVFVETFGDSPTFIRYRTNDGEWQVPFDTGDGYELYVGAQYELVAVCENTGGVDVGFEYGTADETSETFLPCYAPYEGPTEPVSVTGTMAQPGTVVMGDIATSSEPNWSFELAVPQSTYDLVAAGDQRIAIRRNVEVAGTLALDAIDVDVEGAAYTERVFTVESLPGEQVGTRVSLFTQNGGAYLPFVQGTTAKVPPADLLNANDFAQIEVTAFGNRTYRSNYVGASRETNIEFLPVIDNVTFNADGVIWTGELGYGADLYTYARSGSIHLAASPGWVAGKSKLAIDTDIPGFEERWRIDPEYRGFGINDSVGFTYRYSMVDDPTP
jgi:hypothetical protein